VTRAEITSFVASQTDATVQSGPFEGMRLCLRSSWGDGDIAPKLLGVYEQELHDTIYKFSPNDYTEIIDIGAAEGYYAIGLALLFKNLPVRAYDTSELSHSILKENAALNGVSDQISVSGLCDGVLLESLAVGRRLLVILDCEGGEVELFRDSAVIMALRHSDLIIECHDFIYPGITGDLVAKFFPTHLVEVLYCGGRNPNAFPFLANLPDTARWTAICENRPVLMNWIICRSKLPHMQRRLGGSARAGLVNWDCLAVGATR
jgi:hypothetical protein